MSAMTEVATIRMTCGAVPVQFEGTLTDGRSFYFRARGGVWTLGLGDTVDDAVDNGMGDDPVARGDDQAQGFMEHTEVRRLIYAVVADLAVSS